ncbi:MAG: glycosyltransferase family protein [Planctomycetota bacterium]
MLNVGVAELASLRGEITRRALEVFQPDALLVDNFPLGTRLELLPVLRAMRERPTRTALGLRDVVDPPAKVRRDWERDGLFGIVERYYDQVLIYGMREVLDAVESYGFSDRIAERVAYCGYVTERNPGRREPEQVRQELGVGEDFLLATVGGGGDGRPLLETFLEARQRFPECSALVTTGEFMSIADREAVKRRVNGHGHTVVLDHVNDLPSVMAASGLVVSMGGYNTSAEIIGAGARSVVVPRHWRSGEHGAKGKTGLDAEQLVRAEGLASLGAITMVDPRELTAESLGDAMAEALSRPRASVADRMRLDGADRVADQLLALARGNR